ncbi:MAG TPA: metallophosphoesterase [Levilinea sp.]|nr:metallophosphoesterase [Levilinea sp.]
MTTEIDFSQQQEFPGVEGNRFDIILHAAEFVARIPVPIFALLLFFLALIPTLTNWPWTFGLLSFFLVDWLLLALLPKLGLSYGPPQPPVLILAGLRTIFAFIPLPLSFALQVIGTFLVIYSFYIEPHRIRVTHQSLSSHKLRSKKPLRVLHLGDLHIEHITARERQLLAEIERLQPDLILFSGDVLNLSFRSDPQAIEQARAIMRQWTATLGVFGVNGSPAVDLKEILPTIMHDLPMHWLRDQKTTIQHDGDTIDIVGVSCTHRPFEDGPRLSQVLDGSSGNFTILLYHTPDLAPIAARHNIDLQLSGHTHGGQVRLPFYGSVFTGSLYGKRYEAGRYSHGAMLLYITRGIGMEGAGAPRVRFLCPPEIIIWEITGEAS